MVWILILGILAAFGLLSAAWCAVGWFLPKTGTVLLLPEDGNAEMPVRRGLWLRSLGLVGDIILVSDGKIEDTERIWLARCGIELCSREVFLHRLGIGESGFDGTGNGDSAGNHWCSGLSEL